MRKDPPYVVIGAHDYADKAVIVNKSRRLSGWEVHICQMNKIMERSATEIAAGDLSGEYMTLYFCRRDALKEFISALQTALDKWEAQHDD